MEPSEPLRRMLEDATDVYGGRCTIEFSDKTAITPGGKILVDAEPQHFKSLSPVNQFRLIWDSVCHEKWHDKMSDLNGKGDFAERMADEHPDSQMAGQVGGQIWNIVEDAYIDHQRGEENPGMRSSIALMEDAVIGDDDMNPPMGDVPPSHQRQAGLVQLLRGGRVKGFNDATPAAQDYLTWAKVKIDEAKTEHDQDYRTELAEALTKRLLDEVDEPDPPEDPDQEPDHPDDGDGDSGDSDGEQQSDDGDDEDEDGDDSQQSDDPQQEDDEQGDDESGQSDSEGDDEGDGDDEEQGDEDENGDEAGSQSGDDEGDEEGDEEQQDGDESGDGDGDEEDDSTHEDDEDGDDAAADEGDDGDAAENDDEAGDQSGDSDEDDDKSDEQQAREDLQDYDDDPSKAMQDRHGVTPDDAYEASDVDRSQYKALRRQENLPDDSAEKRATERDKKVDDSNGLIPSRTMTNETEDMASDVADEFQRVRTRTRSMPAEDGDSVHFDNAMQRRMGDMSVNRYHKKTERVESGGRAIGVALDCSGSMNPGLGENLIKPARMALVALAEAAETLGDDFMATTFHTEVDPEEDSVITDRDDEFDNDAAPGRANIKFTDEAIIQDVVTRAGEAFEPEHLEVTDVGGGTPTGLGVMDISYLLEQSTRDERLAIVLTDGRASTTNDGWHCTFGDLDEATQDAVSAIEDARARGIKVIGMGIGDVDSDYLEQLFGEGRYVSADRDTMAEELVEIYKDELNVRM